MRLIFTLWIALIAFAATAAAQTLGEMTVEEVPESEGIMYVIMKPDDAVLIVHSNIPMLSFEANSGIYKV